jgi:hypothetical protein
VRPSPPGRHRECLDARTRELIIGDVVVMSTLGIVDDGDAMPP